MMKCEAADAMSEFVRAKIQPQNSPGKKATMAKAKLVCECAAANTRFETRIDQK
jgi:hypothetical protein